MKKIRMVTSGIIIAILMLFMMTVCVRFATKNILMDMLGINNAFTRLVFFDQNTSDENDAQGDTDTETQNSTEAATETNKDKPYAYRVEEVNSDWASLYPFQEDETETERPNQLQLKKQAFENKVAGVKTILNTYTTEDIVGYNRFVSCAGTYNQIIGWNLVRSTEYNNLTVLEDGYLTSLLARVDATDEAKSVNTFNAFLKERDIPFLYIQAPRKIYEGDAVYGTLDFADANVDELLSGFDESVACIDLRKSLLAYTDNYHEAFFISDHHWKPETGLWAAGETARYLNTEMGFSLNEGLLDEDQFQFDVYEDCYVGSHGIRMGTDYEPEDFTFINPKYPVDLTCEIISNMKGTLHWDFRATYDYYPSNNVLDKSRVAYKTYGHSDGPYMKYWNANADNQLKCLILGDSFKDCYVPFMTLLFAETTEIDLRYFDGSLQTFIDANDFDLVINMCNAGAIGSKERDSHTGLYDFR